VKERGADERSLLAAGKKLLPEYLSKWAEKERLGYDAEKEEEDQTELYVSRRLCDSCQCDLTSGTYWTCEVRSILCN
jgi:hypothetical protein